MANASSSAKFQSLVFFIFLVGVGSVLVIFFPDKVQIRFGSSENSDPCPFPGAGLFSPVDIKSTALVSFPGSGNTWTRYLLTTSTGLLTGSYYKRFDIVPMSPNGARARRVVAVKTHELPSKSAKVFPVDRSILLVRNPYEAFLAEFNRRSNTYIQTGIQEKSAFKTEWPRFIDSKVARWSGLYTAWAKYSRPAFVLLYHRMVQDLGRELGHVIRFLNLTNVTPRMHCALQEPEGWVHRKKPDWQKEVAVFNDQQKKRLNSAIDKVRLALQNKTGQDLADMESWKR